MKKFTLLVALIATMGLGSQNAFAACGDGVVDPDPSPSSPCNSDDGCESCDDGAANGTANSNCSSTCRFVCNLNTAGKAAKVGASMVRAYAECVDDSSQVVQIPGGPGGPTAPSCRQETTVPYGPAYKANGNDGATAYVFDEKKGSCEAKITSKLLKDCSKAKITPAIEVTDACHELTAQVTCKGILRAGGTAAIEGSIDQGWQLRTLTRATTIDSSVGPVTIVDFPVQFSFPTPVKGGLKLSATSTEALAAIFGTDTALNGCSVLETIKVEVAAPGGRPFARIGTNTRVKGSENFLL
jgi:hypothetical protein